MERMMGLLFCFPFLVTSLSTVDDPNKDDLDRLQGKWQIVSFVVDGIRTSPDNVWHITGNKVFYRPDSSIYSVIKLDAKQTPKAFDFDTIITDDPAKSTKGSKGIYAIDGDMITFCVSRPGNERPKTFESKKNSGFTLTVLKRAKEK